MPLGMHETFLRLRSDHAMIREVGGLVVMNRDGLWGYAGGEVYGNGLIETGMFGVQEVVDRLTSRSTRIEHPEYVLDDNTHCLIVTTSESDVHSIARLVDAAEKTMPEHTRCDWLHIEWSEGMPFTKAEAVLTQWNGGEFDRNCIRNRTASDKVEYGHREWSAAIIQYLEARMLERAGALDLEGSKAPPRTFGFATLDFSQTEGRRFLKARAFLDAVSRENERVDLDWVFRQCSDALRGGRDIFSRAVSASDMPTDISKLVRIDEDYASFNVRERLSFFRDLVTNDSGTIEKVEQVVEDGLKDLKTQIDGVLDTSSETAQKRLAVIQSLLGNVPDQTQGKPLRTTYMLDDCESECLAKLASFSSNEETPPSVQELHIQRRFCAEQQDNIVSLERAIEIDEEAGIDTSTERQALIGLRKDFEKCEQGFEALRQRYTRFRRAMFASLSTEWMEGLFEQLVEQATYSYTPPVVEEKPLFSPREKKVLIASAFFLPVWLWLSWKIGLQFWFEQLLVSGCYVAVWAVLISLRLGRKKKAPVENPMVEQRRRFIKAARDYHSSMVLFAALTRFQKVFDEEIRKPLLIEYNRLSGVLDHLRSTAGDTQSMVDQSFTEVDFVQHIGNAESFSRFYDEELSAPMSAAPSIVQVYLNLMRSRRLSWTEDEAVDQYGDILSQEVMEHLNVLENFEMLDYILEREHRRPPAFVNPALPPLTELIRQAKISLGALHDCELEDDGRLTIYVGRSENEMLITRFKDEISDMFAESSQARLNFVMTDDSNRIGFLRVVDIDVKAMLQRERQEAHRTRKRKPTPVVDATPGEDGLETHQQEEQISVTSPAGNVVTIHLRGQEVDVELPHFTKEELETVEGLDHFERGVLLVPGQDAEEVVFSRILGYSDFDDVLNQLISDLDAKAGELNLSLTEVLIAFVQAIPYQVGSHEKYPVETLMLGYGDCSDKSTLLRKLLGMTGIDSSLLLFEELQHMALGVRVPQSSPGLVVNGFAFLECTAPFVVGSEPKPLVTDEIPVVSSAEFLLADESLGEWMEYTEYWTAHCTD